MGQDCRSAARPHRRWDGSRGTRVLEGSGDCPERARVLTWQAWVHLWGGDPESALPVFAEGMAAGQRVNDSDLVTMSGLGQGM
jgi:hypothetical protein